MGRMILAADYTSLQTRIIAELTRRNGYGDVSDQATLVYDVDPVDGGYIYKEHPQKILDKLKVVNTAGFPDSVDDLIMETDIDIIEAKLTAFEKQPRNATSNNDCEALCTGMCVSKCTTNCGGGCSGSCKGDCDGRCTGCGGDCSYDCTSCTGECTGCSGCTGSCRNGCKNSCGTVCANTCQAACIDVCTNSNRVQ